MKQRIGSNDIDPFYGSEKGADTKKPANKPVGNQQPHPKNNEINPNLWVVESSYAVLNSQLTILQTRYNIAKSSGKEPIANLVMQGIQQLQAIIIKKHSSK